MRSAKVWKCCCARMVVGTDAGGVLYDGTYKDIGDMVEIALTMTVPPGATLVQGTPPQPRSYVIPVKASFPKVAITKSQPILMQLPPGPVNVIFQCLRPLVK